MRATSRAHPAWWDHQRHSLLRLRRQIEQDLRTMRLPRGTQSVDVGCGDMPYREIIEREGLQYIGCDITPEAPVRITPGVRIPLPDHESRLVTSFQVLEHVWDLDWYLGECRRLLHPEGYLLLSTHGTWLYHPHPTDFRRWTRDGLVREIERHGLAVDRIDGIMGPLAWTTQFRLLGFREVLMRLPVVRSLVLPPLVAAMNARMAFEDAITPDWIRQTNASVYLVVARPA